MELPPGEEVCIEIEVERRRTLGKSLCFVNGPLVVVAAARTTAAAGRLCRSSSISLRCASG